MTVKISQEYCPCVDVDWTEYHQYIQYSNDIDHILYENSIDKPGGGTEQRNPLVTVLRLSLLPGGPHHVHHVGEGDGAPAHLDAVLQGVWWSDDDRTRIKSERFKVPYSKKTKKQKQDLSEPGVTDWLARQIARRSVSTWSRQTSSAFRPSNSSSLPTSVFCLKLDKSEQI